MGAKADDVRKLLEGLVETFGRENIDYALCGSWAVALWGYSRMTTDIDLFIAEKDLDRACRALEPVGFVLKAGRIPLPSAGIEFYGVSAVADSEIVPLDMYPVPEDDPYLGRKGHVVWNDFEVPILDIDDLIAMKSKSERGKDRIDVEELRRIRDEKISD